MTDGMKSQEEQELRFQVGQVRERLDGLTAELHVVDGEVEGLASDRAHHELLGQACGALEKLGERGAAALFWGDRAEPERVAEQLGEVRSRVSAFQARLGELEGRRQEILTRMGREEENLEILGEDLYQVREAEERRKLEWVVERDISSVPRRLQAMAWARGGEDDQRFRRSLAVSLLASLLFAVLLPMIDLPLPRLLGSDDVLPRRIAQFIRQEQVKPIPPSPVVAQDIQDQNSPETPVPEPAEAAEPSGQPPEAQAAAAPESAAGAPGPPGLETPRPGAPGPPRRDAASAGILAFADQIASLASDRVAPRLGADARFGDADDVSRASSPSRSLLTTNVPGSSGGIDIASLSRNVGGGGGGGGGSGEGGGGGGGGGMPGVEVGRASSPIASIAGDDRPTASGGPGLSRTDEEIQIVFDRYKAEFYRLYNRELRINPALQGQMVLRLTIEPDGSVSMCMLQATDMDAPNLAGQVVSRVRTIDFGAKEGVEALTIVYPIDFLPASDG